MFNRSTQKANWMFAKEEIIHSLQMSTHEQYLQSAKNDPDLNRRPGVVFLTLEEATGLRMFYERKLLEFCVKFVPPMPKAVQGTAVQYYKRFYIKNSVMDYHPKEIL